MTIQTTFYRTIALALMLTWTTLPAIADDYIWAADYPVGTTIPQFETTDSDGALRKSEELIGPEGMLLFFVRSTDW